MNKAELKILDWCPRLERRNNMTDIEYIKFRNWLLEEARQAKIKLSVLQDEYSAGYSDALRDVVTKLGEVFDD